MGSELLADRTLGARKAEKEKEKKPRRSKSECQARYCSANSPSRSPIQGLGAAVTQAALTQLQRLPGSGLSCLSFASLICLTTSP